METVVNQMAVRRRHDRPGSRLAGACAILVGLLYVLLLVYVVATPAEQRVDPGAFFEYYAQDPLPLSAAWIMIASTSVLALAIVPAMWDLVRSVNEEWARFASILGIMGYVTLAVNFATLLGRVPGLAATYVTGSAATREAILAAGLPELDPNGWMMFGAAGTWAIIINILALRGGKLRKVHALFGIATGLCLWSTVLGDLLTFEPLHLIAAGGGAIAAPIWHVWLGIGLLRQREQVR